MSKYYITLVFTVSLISCKKEIKDDFSWDGEKEAETKKETPVLKESNKGEDPFEFDTSENEPTKILHTQFTGDPTFGTQVIDGSALGEQTYTYDTDAQLLFLAATKLCSNFNYKNIFGEYRKGTLKNGKERIKIDHCCSAYITSPYIEPMEYYLNLYHNYNDVSEYKDNVFKLREIRENTETKKREAFNKLIADIDPENLVSYKLVTASIERYDFNTTELNIKYYINYSLRIGKGSVKAKLTDFSKKSYRYQSSRTYNLNMSEKDAKILFDYYATLSEYSKNPPFKLVTKTTFAIGIPKLQKRPYNFETKIKTIEFYKMANGYPTQENKIAEIQINYDKN